MLYHLGLVLLTELGGTARNRAQRDMLATHLVSSPSWCVFTLHSRSFLLWRFLMPINQEISDTVLSIDKKKTLHVPFRILLDG